MGDHRVEWEFFPRLAKKFESRPQMARLTGPGAENLKLFARDDVWVERHCAGVAIMAQHQVLSSVAAHFHSLDHRRRMPCAFQDGIRAVAAAQFSDRFEPLVRLAKFFEIDDVIDSKF